MTVCLPFSDFVNLTVNSRTVSILVVFLSKIVYHTFISLSKLNDIGTGLVVF